MEGERERKRKRGEESEERDGATENRTHTRASILVSLMS